MVCTAVCSEHMYVVCVSDYNTPIALPLRLTSFTLMYNATIPTGEEQPIAVSPGEIPDLSY